jgi:prolyl-tRNA synthetase
VHLRGVDVDRDIRVGRWADLREVAAGEPCPVCGEPLEALRAIEVGHMAAIVECHHDAAGIVWPVAVAPFMTDVVALDPGDPGVAEAVEAVTRRLEAAGTDVLVDDRDERPGVRLRDAELIGFPFRVTVGARDLAAGRVELVRRDTGERQAVPVDAVADRVLSLAGPAARRG